MTPEEEVEFRRADIMWFDGDVQDADGRLISMYSTVTPTTSITQTYALDEPPTIVPCGVQCRVVGTRDGNRDWLWLEIDDLGSEWSGAHIVLHRTAIRELPDT